MAVSTVSVHHKFVSLTGYGWIIGLQHFRVQKHFTSTYNADEFNTQCACLKGANLIHTILYFERRNYYYNVTV